MDAGPGQVVHEDPAAPVDRARAVPPQRGLVARARVALVQLEVVPRVVRRFDPQTSGGLLASVDAAVIDELDGFTMVGTVEVGGPGVRLT